MYSMLKDGPLAVVSLSTPCPPKKSRIGIYDNNILCEDCDGLLGNYDQYVCERFKKENLKVRPVLLSDGWAVDENGRSVCFELPDVEPEKLVKFVLSVLWRAHLSARPEAKVVKLGPHAAPILDILKQNISIEHHPYSVYLEYNPDLDMVMFQGAWRLDGGVNVNSFLCQQFSFHTKIDKRADPFPFGLIKLLPDRQVYALNIKKLSSKFGHRLAQRIKSSTIQHPQAWEKLSRGMH